MSLQTSKVKEVYGKSEFSVVDVLYSSFLRCDGACFRFFVGFDFDRIWFGPSVDSRISMFRFRVYVTVTL